MDTRLATRSDRRLGDVRLDKNGLEWRRVWSLLSKSVKVYGVKVGA
jgi:hypothetical protein